MILLYHLIFPDDTPPDQWTAGYVMRIRDFKKQVQWIEKHFRIVSLEEYLKASNHEKKNLAAITFDDGYHHSFEMIASYLVSRSIPATFFVNTAHLERPGLLWFVYFNALCFEKLYSEIVINHKPYPLSTLKACTFAWQTLISQARKSGDTVNFAKSYMEKYPLPEIIIDKYSGLSEEQIRSFDNSSILELGGHTHNHPFLDQVSYDIQLYEISKNKTILEEISKKSVRYFSYTGGYYNSSTVSALIHLGFEAAFAVQPRFISSEKTFEIPRTEVYSPSLWKLMIKIYGLESTARKIHKIFRVSNG